MDTIVSVTIKFDPTIFTGWPDIVCKAKKNATTLTDKQIRTALYMEVLSMIYSSKIETGETKKRNTINTQFEVNGPQMVKTLTDGTVTYTFADDQMRCNRWGGMTFYRMIQCGEYEAWDSDSTRMTLKHGEILEGNLVTEDDEGAGVYQSAYVRRIDDTKGFNMSFIDGVCDGMAIG
jgi:hypothetical protein